MGRKGLGVLGAERPLESNTGAAAKDGGADASNSTEPNLVGYWKLRGDCRDYSGHGNHGVNHGVQLDRGAFDGLRAHIEVPSSASLKLGTGDFALCAWIYTEKELDDVVGDVLDLYDPSRRRGITLSVNSSGSGYQGQGSDRHVCFGIDNARVSDWQDCGRPSRTSPYVSNSILVYKGKLYAAITDAKNEKDWRHVFRYEAKQKWTDCGRVGTGRTTGVGPLVVHNGDLYAVTWLSLGQQLADWARLRDCRVCQAVIAAFVGISQLPVIQAECLKQRGVEIVNAHYILNRLVAELICRPMHVAVLETTAGEPE
jgi:hypothetical protein